MDTHTNPISAQVFNYGKDFVWIISELARQLNITEFENYAGCNINEIDEIVNLINNGEKVKDITNKFESVNHEFVKSMVDLHNTGVDVLELSSETAWGKTPSGKVIIIDSGMTKDIKKEHYPHLKT